MRILLGSFQCESNTFNERLVGVGDFEVYRGGQALGKMAATRVFADAGAEVAPLLFASALPGGKVSREAYDFYAAAFVEEAGRNLPADGIYLYLHGSMYVDGLGCGEEALIRDLRREVGGAMPISVALDFHANLSPGFVGSVNAVNGFRTAPHTDHDDTEERAARVLLKCVREKILPVPVGVRLPFLCGDAATTDREPFVTITRMLERCDAEPAVVSAAFFNGQPWYDAAYTGARAVVSATDGGAGRRALELAKIFWNGRESLTLANALPPEEAVDASLRREGRPLFVTDSGDNTTAGALGKGTLLLNLYLRRKAEGVLVCGILDREAVGGLAGLPPGTTRRITLCPGRREAQEIHTDLEVTTKGEGRVFGWAGDEVGKGVLAGCCGVDVVFTDARAAFTTPEHFARMGVDPRAYSVVVLKMGYLFPRLREISDSNIFALTPGQSTNDFSTLPYRDLGRRVYPLARDIAWGEVERRAATEATRY